MNDSPSPRVGPAVPPTGTRWAPGPAPQPDGLAAAFRSADRRRLRTALASTSVPVVLACAALALPSSGAGSSSLQMTPAGPGRGGRPAAGAVTTRPAEPTPAASAFDTAGTSAGTARDDAGPGRAAPPPTAVPSLPLPTRPAGSYRSGGDRLAFSADRNAVTHVDLAEDVHPDLDLATFTVGGTYGGIYLVSDDGTVSAGVVALPGPDGQRVGIPEYHGDLLGSATELPAGGYTVYVLGDGRTEVTVPIADGERGLTTTATAPAEVRYVRVVDQFATGSTSAENRLALDPDANSVGFVGAWLTSVGGQGKVDVSACLAEPGAACAADDPHDHSTVGVGVDSSVGTVVPVKQNVLDGGRDLVTNASLAAATDAQLVSWYLVLVLDL